MNKGLYIHVPFCRSKCPYCDFFSVRFDDETADKYVEKVIDVLSRQSGITADTLYFGGGTPGILGTDRIVRIVTATRKNIVTANAEVTIEVNPESANKLDFAMLKSAGINRLSIGLQSAVDSELRLLGRLHNAELAAATVRNAQSAGFENISLDLMIATSTQTEQSLAYSIDFCADLGVQHISAYILKLEQGTPYYKNQKNMVFPDDDTQADMYLYAVDKLKQRGYIQYEISNFSLPGKESKHNLKYWFGDEYLGIGPSAHSFLNGKRFFCSRNFDDFYNDVYIPDGDGGSEEEYIMLRLRLTEGLQNDDYKERFGTDIPQKYFDRAKRLAGLAECTDTSIKLTVQGFLLSNTVISDIIC